MNEVYEPELDYDDVKSEVSSSKEELVAPVDAFWASLNRNGEIDLQYISKRCGRTVDELIELFDGNLMFQDPAYFIGCYGIDIEKGWVIRPRYLSGNIHDKYELAKQMHTDYPALFEKNVKVLKELQPERLVLEDIHVALGATWIPIEIYEEFIKDLLQLKQKPQVLYINRLGKWIVTIPETARNSVLNTITFGTMDMTAAKIIECSMNAKTIKVYDTIPQLGKKDLRIINKSKTYAALEKQNTIIREFENWVMEVPKRKETLQDCYNEAFVGYITSKYDGSVLDFPDLNPEIHLYPRQRNTLARLLFSRENVLVPHKVGSGKTYIMVCAAHELHRIGMSKKNMIVVPNNVLQGTVSAHKLLYPKDKILVITPESFVGEAKNQFLYEIQTHGDEYIAIYMAYSSFDQVNMSKGYWIERRRSEIRDLRRATANAKTKREALQLRSAADRLAKKLSEYVLEGKDTLLIPFEDLGINTLFVDEAHNYKNIELHSR